jgi:hypothetical protein
MLKEKTAFSALMEIGYSLSDYQEPAENDSICYVCMSRSDSSDVVIMVERGDLDEFFEESGKC